MKTSSLRPILAAAALLSAAVAVQAQIRITEVAPWSSSSPVGDDWFELTNFGSSSVTITGWKMDDNSNSFSNAVPMSGISSIGAGESVIFIEAANNSASTDATNFKNVWFGGTLPAGLQIGSYSGSGVGLSSSGDAVNVFNSTGVLQANVSFGASPTGTTPTFDNAAGLNNTTISLLSVVGTNGAFVAPGDSHEIGSPGVIPEPSTYALLVGLASGAVVAIRRRFVRAA